LNYLQVLKDLNLQAVLTFAQKSVKSKGGGELVEIYTWFDFESFSFK